VCDGALPSTRSWLLPTFCRHNRFIERCPICSKSLPDRQAPSGRAPRAGRATRAGSGAATGARRSRGDGLRVQREGRAQDDGYRCGLVPGLRASADASRLADEIGFASGRLLALAALPPGLYDEARALGASDLERATWMCFLIAYFSPLQDEDDPFVGIRMALAACDRARVRSGVGAGEGVAGEGGAADGASAWLAASDAQGDLAEIPLGPRTCHAPERGAETLIAYLNWADRAGASQAAAFTGDPTWSPERRFERLLERLALPGFGRAGRYELLLVMGRLGLYEMRADALHLGGARGMSASDPTTLAAKRVFGIGDPLLLERRAATLAHAMSVPVEAFDLALSNWSAPQRATLGFATDTSDPDALARVREALEL
jgi:Alpha-glutamyl/putrescinyl thymine pyrophosphorylase clade 3